MQNVVIVYNSSIVSGNNSSSHNCTDTISEMEAELLRIFRLLPLRERIDVMKMAYIREDEIKKSPA